MQNSDKKPRFKFNFFDILILTALMVVVVVLSVYSVVMTENSYSEEGRDGFRYTLKAEKTDDAFISMIRLGDILYEDKSGEELGRVVDVRISDYTESYTIGDKTVVKQVRGYSNLEITVECYGASYVDNSGIVNIQSNGYSMRVGTDVKVRNAKLIFNAQCTLLEKAEVKDEEA